MERKRSIQCKPRLDFGEHVDRMPKFSSWRRNRIGGGLGLDSRLTEGAYFSVFIVFIYFLSLLPNLISFSLL